jgi:flavin-dependent dehydrogenase
METVEHLIVGAGPAGLRAGQVLADAGREVLVVEKHAEIGPKTCAGGRFAVALPALDQLSRWRVSRRAMARWFLAG